MVLAALELHVDVDAGKGCSELPYLGYAGGRYELPRNANEPKKVERQVSEKVPPF